MGRVDVARGLRSDEVSGSSGCHGRYYITYCVTNVYCPSEMSIDRWLWMSGLQRLDLYMDSFVIRSPSMEELQCLR